MKDERKERRMKERKRKAARKDENGTRLRLLQTTVRFLYSFAAVDTF